MNAQFWAGRRVFITGHTGFKGSWLCLWLQHLGADVSGYALEAPTQPSLFAVADVGAGMTSTIGDVGDRARLLAALQQQQPEVVFHMAAQSLVRRSYVEPVETYATNVMGTVHLLDAIRQVASVRAVVVVTSDKCYENREWVWGYREDEAMGGHDPYSNSKGCAELVTAAFRNSFFSAPARGTQGVGIASGRAGNVIGGGDWASDRLIPDMVRAFSSATPVVIRNPHAVRPWQHVMEPLSGYMRLAQSLFEQGDRNAQGFNFGPSEDDAKPVGWIVERLVALWGQGASFVLDQSEHPHEAHFLRLDCSKARQQLGWQARWTLATALERIVQWHRAHQSGADMRTFTIEQIKEYSV